MQLWAPRQVAVIRGFRNAGVCLAESRGKEIVPRLISNPVSYRDLRSDYSQLENDCEEEMEITDISLSCKTGGSVGGAAAVRSDTARAFIATRISAAFPPISRLYDRELISSNSSSQCTCER